MDRRTLQLERDVQVYWRNIRKASKLFGLKRQTGRDEIKVKQSLKFCNWMFEVEVGECKHCQCIKVTANLQP